MLKTITKSSKFYVFFHLVPFMLKLRKNLKQGKLSKSFQKALQKYIRSILFIAHLVGGLKLLLCSSVSIAKTLKIKLDGTNNFKFRKSFYLGHIGFIFRNLLGITFTTIINHLFCIRKVYQIFISIFKKEINCSL